MNTPIKRRDFLKNSMMASLAVGAGVGLSAPARALAACDVVAMPRTLVNIMLYGGMDSRFIFMPSPNHDVAVSSNGYMEKIWAARANLYPTAYASYADMFAAEYLPVTDPGSGLQFGIYNRCGWLKTEFEAGRVAVVANSFCSKNRRHDQSQLNANVGEPAYNELYYDRDGIGGRLVEAIGSGNTVELSHEISVFGNGSTSGSRLAQVIHAQNTRDIALPNVRTDRNVVDDRNVMTRALQSYYEARGAEVAAEKPTNWPYHLFYQHNDAFREFGDAVKARLDDCGALPASLATLDLYQNHFEQQCKNLYDVCLAPDVLNVRTVSMRYDGWDTHNNQAGRIGNNLEDLFGTSAGLATAMSAISTIPTLGAPANEQLTCVFKTDFGRQIRANGDNGTDHGRGVYTILWGHDVNGGVYGEMFPEREAVADGNGRIPLETSGADIEGRTSTERVMAEACDWLEPGTSSSVFPNAGSSDLEAGVSLNNLFV